jgi:hypothetical protein
LAELRQIRDFVVDFGLTDSGDQKFQSFGEACQNEIWKRAYPILAKAMKDAPTNGVGEPPAAGEQSICEAVKIERQRLVGKKVPKLAETELGRSIQKQLGAPAAMVDRRLKEVAKEVLKKAPLSGRKH